MKFATGMSALAVVIASIMAISQARAVVEQETFSSNPSARCQPALPAFDGLIRKRPLAMVNEGTTSAFVSCAFETEVGQSTAQQISIFFSNATAAAVNITCTGVSGWDTRATNEYLPLTISIPAGGQNVAPFQWADADFVNGTGGLISVSCALPPGTAVNDSYVDYSIDDAP